MRRQATARLPVGHDTDRDEAAHAEVTHRDLSTHLVRAMQRLGVQVKEIAFYWGTDHGYVSRVLANRDPLPDHRIEQLPRELRCALLEEWAGDLGLTVGRKADIGRALESLARLCDERLDVPMRMAKASLPGDGDAA
jgi:hypothetical protein